MNYITACPNCETQFLLDDALIKTYRGKVQCGHCDHVFNAKNRLTAVTDDMRTADEDQADAEEIATEKNQQVLISENSIVSDSMQDAMTESKQEESEQGAPADEQSQPVELIPVNQQEDVDYVISPLASEVEPTNQTTVQTELPEQSANINAIFTHKNRGHKKSSQYSFWIGLINFILLITIPLLCAYFLRAEIANRFPPIRPLLERACVPLKCTIDLSKNLDLITIGDSDMQEDDTYQSVIQLTSAIKNNANYPQAYPSLELTLTDDNDHAVIKKLITPTLYLASNEKIKRGLESNETATIKLSFHVDDPSVASYRILLLY
jgi:predicted Zn finger-like uncharacterized protein